MKNKKQDQKVVYEELLEDYGQNTNKMEIIDENSIFHPHSNQLSFMKNGSKYHSISHYVYSHMFAPHV